MWATPFQNKDIKNCDTAQHWCSFWIHSLRLSCSLSAISVAKQSCQSQVHDRVLLTQSMLESINKMPTPQLSWIRYRIVRGMLDPLPTVLLCSLTINCMSKTRSCTVNADLLVANHDCVNLPSRGMLTQSMLESINKIPAPQFCVLHCSSVLSNHQLVWAYPCHGPWKQSCLHTADEQQRTKRALEISSRVGHWCSLF